MYVCMDGWMYGCSGEGVKVSAEDERRFPTSPFESLCVRFDNDDGYSLGDGEIKSSAGATRVSPWEVALAPFQMFNNYSNNNNNNSNSNNSKSLPLPTPDVVGASFLPPQASSNLLFSPARREACLATVQVS